MSDWTINIKVPEKPTYVDMQVGQSKTVKFLNDEPKTYQDPLYKKEKIAFDVEYEGKASRLIFNTSNISAMQGLKSLYPIANKVVAVSKSGSKLKPIYSFTLIE